MAKPERRISPRFKLHTPLTFHRMEAISEGTQEANAINISTRGVYFASSLVFCVGEALEVSLEVPRRVTGTKPINRRFASRVAHVESECMPQGQSGIGVQFLYYEMDLASPATKKF
jgi:PilZ domain-containing protein